MRAAPVLNCIVASATLLPFVHLSLGALLLVPPIRPIIGPFAPDLTANPIKYTIAETGYWALVILVASLAITPLRRLLKWNELIRVRRLLGLVAFFYATLHVFLWAAFDRSFDVAWILEDGLERRYLTMGMVSFSSMVPLALTSNMASITRLGRRWRVLHRLAYVAALSAILHFWWSGNIAVADAKRFAIILMILLGLRAGLSLARGRRAPRAFNEITPKVPLRADSTARRSGPPAAEPS
jgi:methionine sulfoxide reductase heme-binding subunit